MFANIVFVVLINVVEILAAGVPIVKIPLGQVSGVYDTSYKGRFFSAFYGIPYAQPPIGGLRFKEPQPIVPWKGTWVANMTETSCAQISHGPEQEGGYYIGEEDCLYLHVFVPAKYPDKVPDLLDVVVHIHGGAFMFGNGLTYAGPRFLMDANVILVTLNYRVGFLGFMSTEDDVVPGNNGMKDQSMALKWIKDNIKSFGGNPDSITITGLSAGGASVHYHYLSPLSRGLFQRGISVSGTALGPWTMQENALDKAKFLAVHLGCPQVTTKQMVECLKTRPAKQIVEVTRLLRPWLFNPFSPLGLVVEKGANNTFLPEHPFVLLSEGKFYDVPWITSLTSEEGLYPGADFLIKENYLPDLERRWKELAPYVLDYNYTIPQSLMGEVTEKIKNEYLKGKPISRDTYKQLIDMISDRHFCLPGEMAAKIQATVAKSPVYFYYFSFPGDTMESLTTHWTGQDQDHGVSHGDDMCYIFSYPFKEQKLSKPDEDIQDILLNIWKSFMQTNKPRIPNVEWIPVSKDKKEVLRHLHIKSPNNIFMEDVHNIDRHRSMWQNIPFEENEHLFSIYGKDEL